MNNKSTSRENKNRYSKNNLSLSLEYIWYFPFQIYLSDLLSGLHVYLLDNEHSLAVQRTYLGLLTISHAKPIFLYIAGTKVNVELCIKFRLYSLRKQE